MLLDIRAAADGEDRFGRTVVLAGAMHDHQAALLDRDLSRGRANAEEALQQVVGIIAGAALLVALAWWFSRGAGTAMRAVRAAAPGPPVPAAAGPADAGPVSAADAAAAGRADVERHLADSPLTAEEVRGALAG
jgi:hypothetical protein